MTLTAVSSDRRSSSRDHHKNDDVEGEVEEFEILKESNSKESICCSISDSSSYSPSPPDMTMSETSTEAPEPMSDRSLNISSPAAATTAEIVVQSPQQQQQKPSSKSSLLTSDSTNEEEEDPVVTTPIKPNSKASLSSSGGISTANNSRNSSNDEDNISMGLSPISSSNRAAATAAGGKLGDSVTSNLSVSATNHNTTNINLMHDSWQTGATRKKKNTGRVGGAASKKWKDPFASPPTKLSPKSPAAAAGGGGSKKKNDRIPPIPRTISGGPELLSPQNSSSDNENVSKRTQFRRTASVPADIASLTSGQSQFPASSIDNKKIQLKELLGLESSVVHTKQAPGGGSRSGSGYGKGGGSSGLSVSSSKSENITSTTNNDYKTAAPLATKSNNDAGDVGDADENRQQEASISRRSQFRRSTSVPLRIGVADLPAVSSRPTTPTPEAYIAGAGADNNMAVKDYLTEFLHNGETEAPLLMNQHNDAGAAFNDHDNDEDDGGDDTDGDSTIEESWHQLSDKRRILAEAMEISSGVPPDMPQISSSTATVKSSSSAAGTTATAKTVGGGVVNNKSSLDNFLDALIFDAKKSTSEKPEEQSLSRRSHSERRRKSGGGGGGGGGPQRLSSVRSVGGGLDNSPTIYIKGGPMTSQQQHQGYDAAASPEKGGKTAGVLWARRGQKPRSPRSERIQSKASLMSSASSISSVGHGSVLSAFLERESKHGRPSAAHSVAGDRVASSGAISIVLSEDGQSKTFTVGAREAKLVEKLLQATNEVQSPEKQITSTTSMKGWLEQVAGNLKSPSGHSEIQNSARVSTRSSLAVELSPPLVDGSLKSYLDAKRGRRGGRGGAFTVAGDRVSTRFQGKSTQEMLKMLDADRARKRLPGAPPLASAGGRTKGGAVALPVRPASAEPRRHKSHTGEAHSRNHHPYVESGDLANLKYSGGLPPANLHNSMPVISYDPDGQNDDDIEGSDRVFPRSFEVPLSSEDADDRIDGRIAEEKHRRRARSTTPTKGRVMHDGMTENPKRATSNPKPRGGGHHMQQRPRTPTGGKQKGRLGDSLNVKDVDLKDFRPPASTRPMNRRSLMRKMHSVPVMSDTNFHLDDDDDDDDDQATPAASGGKTAKKPKKKSLKKRSKSDASSSSRKSRSKRNIKDSLSSSMHASPVSAALKEEDEREMDFAELRNKSFLDRLLDGEVDAHDSASQINGPDSPVKAPLQAKEDYKAGLMDAPIEESISKLRIEPDYLDGTNRMILQDPGKAGQSRRDLMSQKKQRSASNLMNTSSALKDLYDSPKVDVTPAAPFGDDEDESVVKSPMPEGDGIAAAKSPLKSTLQKSDHKRKGSKTKSKSVSEGTKKKKKTKSVSESTKMKSPSGRSKSKSKSKSMSAASPDDALKSGSKHGKKSKSATEYELKLPSTHARKDDDSKDDDESNFNSPSVHSTKSPSKKKKTPKSKKGKVSKEGKKGKRTRSSSARRRVSTDDEDEKKGFRKKNAVLPGAGLRRSSSCSRLDVDILSVEDNLLQERIHSLTRDHSPPPTPNSEKAVMGDKPLRKGRKPKNPNQVSMTGEPGERKRFIVENSRWKSPLRDRDGSPRRERDGSPRRDRDGSPRRDINGSPRRSPRREREENLAPGSPRLPVIPPFGQSTERSEDENLLQSEFGGSPTPVRKPNVQLNSQGLKSALKTDGIASPQQSPRRYTRPIPVTGRENTVLEVPHEDDDSVVSDITDHYFDVTEEDVARYKMKSTPNLSRIDEPNGEEDDAAAQTNKVSSGGSWAGLSHSFKSRDGNDAGTVESQDHKARRWHSMRDLGSAHSGAMSAPRTPLRGSNDTDNLTEKDGTKTPTRLGWLKKRLGLAKKK